MWTSGTYVLVSSPETKSKFLTNDQIMVQNAEPHVNLWADAGPETQVQTIDERWKQPHPQPSHLLSQEIKL